MLLRKMLLSTLLLSLLLATFLSLSSVSGVVYQGFNYGSTFNDQSPKQQSDFENEFNTAKALIGAPANGFTSARLYTVIQAGTSNSPISAIPAAIHTNTTLLLGLWASAGDAVFANEVAALKSAISQYGTNFTSLIAGISVGSEDLYRITPTGIANKAGVGVGPEVLTGYISQVRSALSAAGLSTVRVGHVDTWTAWVNKSNNAVIQACDFIGMDAYPYYQTTVVNSIDVGNASFWEAYQATVSAVSALGGTQPVWITETGWPVSGATENLAVASVANAQTYWDEVGCAVFGQISTWWFTLQDADPITPSPSFGIIGTNLNYTPIYNISC